MKKYILSGIAVLAVATVVALNVSLNSQSEELSDLSLANVEALADGEGSTGNTVTCYSEGEYKSGAYHYSCGACVKENNRKGKGTSSTCVY